MRRPRWYRYQAVIIGLESGHRSAIPFVRFRNQRRAMLWVLTMTTYDPNPLTRWSFEEIPR